MRYITDLAATQIATQTGLTLDELQIAAGDAAVVWRFVAANEWIADLDLRTWASEHGFTADRVNNAIRILTATNRLFAFEDTPISPTPQVDTTPPTLQQAAVNGNVLTLVYSESLDPASVPAIADFRVTVDGSSAAVGSVAVSGSVVHVALQVPATPGQVVRLGYTPAANPLRDYSFNSASALVETPVENHTPLALMPKPELVKRARALGVEGTSDLDKPELVRAIQEAEVRQQTARAE